MDAFKKENVYTSLSNLDHKTQYAKVVAVISAITPIISRMRMCSVDLELSDSTMHNPGFVVKLKMESEVLSQFLDVAKVGSVVEMLEMKITKNEGIVYGEVYDEDMIQLYNENVTLVKWNSEAVKYIVSDEMKLAIKSLLQWKKANFSGSVEALLLAKESHTETRRSRASSSRADATSPEKRLKPKDSSVDSSDREVSFDESPTRKKLKSENKNLRALRGKDSIETGSPSRRNKSTMKSSEALPLAKELHTETRRSRASSSGAGTTSPDKRIKSKDSPVDSSNSDVLFDESPPKKSLKSQNENLRALCKKGKDSIETGSPPRRNKSTMKSSEALPLAKELHTETRRSRASLSRARATSPDKRIKSKGSSVDSCDSDVSFDETPTRKRLKSENKNLRALSKTGKDSIGTRSPSIHNKSTMKSSESSDVQRKDSPKRKSSSNNVQELKLLSPKHVKITPNNQITLRSCSNSPQNSTESSINKSNDVTPLAKSTPKSKSKEELSISLCTDLLKNKSIADVRMRRSTCQPNKNDDITNFSEDDSQEENDKLKNTISLNQVNKIKDNKKLDKNINKGESNSTEFKNKIIIEDNSNLNEKTLRSKKHKNKADSSDMGMSISKVESSVRTRSNSSLTGKNKSSENSENITIKAKDASITFDCKKGVKDRDSSTNSLNVGKERRTRQSKNISSNSIELINEANESSSLKKKEKRLEIVKLLSSESDTFSSSDCDLSPETKLLSSQKNRFLTSSDSGPDTSSESSSVSLNFSACKKRINVKKNSASSKYGKKIKTPDNSKKDKHVEMICEISDQSIVISKEMKQTPEMIDENKAGKEVKKKIQETVKVKDAVEVIKGKDTSTQLRVDDVSKKIQSKSSSDVESSSKTQKGAGVNVESKKTSPTLNSSIRLRNKSPISTNSNDDNKKQTRNSVGKMNDVKGQLSKQSKKKDGVFRYLESLTRDVLWRQAHLIDDISMCDLEDIDTPEKFDLECKIISKFTLIEDDIEVLRVQDGTLCPRGTLVIPQCPTWNDVTESILKNPTLKKNSPFVDIIIFNFTRIDAPVVPNKCYKIRNVMAVKFQLKDDPRKGNIPKGELFYCAEGQNTHLTKLNKKSLQDIEQRISSETYKKAWQEDVGSTPEKSNVHTSSDELKSSKSKDVLEKNKSERFLSDDTKKRQLHDLKLDTQVETSKILKKNREVEDKGNVTSSGIEKEGKNLIDHAKKTNVDENSKIPAAVNRTTSSDETMLEETPPMLRELSEIMHEESLLGLPFSPSEDVHLKNTGSEVTFSQFCEGAKGKALNFRTSTQQESLSQGIVCIKDTATSQNEEIDKMEPLVYCPSSPSTSSGVEVLSDKHKNEVAQDSTKSSPSVLLSDTARKDSDKTLNSSRHEISSTENQNEKKAGKDTASDTSSLSPVEVLSSSSSDLDIQVIEDNSSIKKKTQTKNEISNISNKKTSDSKIKKSFENQSSHKGAENTKNDVTIKENVHHRKFTDEDGIDKDEDEEIILCGNSSDTSLYSVGSDNEIVFSAKPLGSTSLHKQPRLVENEANDLCWYHVEENLQKVPDECFFHSTPKLPLLAQDELNSVFYDENSSIKFFSYSHDRTLPFLTADVIFSMAKKNYLTTTVTFINITPALKDISQESFIKSRCPSCNKLFSVYNPADNQSILGEASNAALFVGNHIVCPDSECCNQILETPEFYFDVELKLKDGSQLKSSIGEKFAEDIFGCTAQDAVKNEASFNQVREVLKEISTNISCNKPLKVDLTRKDICDPKSGPLYIKKIYL